MKLSEIMTKPVVLVDPETTLVEAVKLMEESGCAFLPVVRDGGVVGVVTDRDIAVRGIGRGLDPGSVSVDIVMSSPVWTVGSHLDGEDAAVMMRLHHVRRLVVVQERGEPVGVVTLVDLAGCLPDQEISDTLHLFSDDVDGGVYCVHHEPIPGLYTG